MFTAMLLRMEYHELKRRAEEIEKMLAIHGLTNELVIKMQQLKRDVDDLADRTDEELEKLELK